MSRDKDEHGTEWETRLGKMAAEVPVPPKPDDEDDGA
jgi:hypothetical protein